MTKAYTQLDSKNLINRRTLEIQLKRIWKYKMRYVFILPAILVLFTFAYRTFPMMMMAFRDYNIITGFEGQQWVGLKYFKEFINSKDFFLVIRNTLGISITSLVIGFPAPIILALMLNECVSKMFKKTVQTVTFLPHFISFIAIAGLAYQLLSVNDGVINEIMVFFGGQPINFLAEGKLFWPLLAILNTFKEMGYSSIIYLAALAVIDQQLYEAVIVDGAGKWKQFIHVTLPGLMPTIITLFILRIGHLLGSSLEQINALQNGFNMAYSDTIEMFIFREGIQRMNYSFTTAVGVFQSAINFCLLILTNMITKKLSQNEQGIL